MPKIVENLKEKSEYYLNNGQNVFDSKIDNVFQSLKIKTCLCRANIKKREGYHASYLLFILFMLLLLQLKTVHSFCRKQWHQWSICKKDTYYRFKQNANGARQVNQFIGQGYKVAVDTDLSKFFDKVNHDVFMNRVSCQIQDKRVLKLIAKYLRAGVMVKGRLQAMPAGVSQGGPLSPLLANILLDDLDKELESRGHHFVRYADDCVPRRHALM